jgi:hypothetical protein
VSFFDGENVHVSLGNRTEGDKFRHKAVVYKPDRSGPGRLCFLPKQTDNLPVIGKATGFMFGKDLFAVRADSEHTAGTGNEFNLGVAFLYQFSLQTGGSGLIVSGCAVFNGYLHRLLLVGKLSVKKMNNTKHYRTRRDNAGPQLRCLIHFCISHADIGYPRSE